MLNIYDLPKGFIKKFNDINQDAKTIFNKYYVTYDGLMYGNEVNDTHGGFHVCRLTQPSPLFDIIGNGTNKIFILYADVIFQTIKEFKSKLKYLIIERSSGDCYLQTDNIDERTLIGALYSHGYTSSNLMSIFADARGKMDEFETVFINKNDILEMPFAELLVANDCISSIYETKDLKYKTRITREIIPGLKKTHNLDMICTPRESDGINAKYELFNMIIRCERDTMTSYHMYKCFNTI